MDQAGIIVSTEEIRRLKSRYFRAIDLKDGTLLRSLFTDDVSINLIGAATDPVSGLNLLPGSTAGILVGLENVMIAYLESLNGLVSVHHGHMGEINIIDADHAEGIWAMADYLRFSNGPIRGLTGYGHYHDTFQRVGNDWKIRTLRLDRIRVDIER